jgi:hypothetical protein
VIAKHTHGKANSDDPGISFYAESICTLQSKIGTFRAPNFKTEKTGAEKAELAETWFRF